MDTAYFDPRGQTETIKKYRRGMYEVIRNLLSKEAKPMKTRTEAKWPDTDWDRIWKNLWMAPITGNKRATWYKIIHDIVPTNERLHKIRIAPNDKCRLCEKMDTLLHRLKTCGEERLQWAWTKVRIATMRRMDPKLIEEEWLLRPQFQLWPPQRHRAILWTLATYVTFRLSHGNGTLGEYRDYIKGNLWNLYQKKDRLKLVGNYLRIII